MTTKSSRILAIFLAVCLGISLIPASLWVNEARAESYGMVINGSVKLRKEAAKNSEAWPFTLPEGWVCTMHTEKNAGGIHWYRVIAPHPEAANPKTARTYWGYIPESNFRPLTSEETAEYLATMKVSSAASSSSSSSASPSESSSSTASTTATNTVVTGTTGSITAGGTNFREGPSKKYHSMMKLDRGTVVSITSVPDGVGEDYWYGVSYAGRDGYVNSEFIRVFSEGGSSTITVSPTATPTPASGGSSSTDGYNAVQLIKSSCHMRNAPAGTFDRDYDWEGAGSILPLAGTPTTLGEYTWYPVSRNGKTFYVRSDCVRLVSSGGGPTPTSAPSPSTVLGYVVTIKSGCNLRATPGGTTIRQIPKNQTLPYLLAPVKSGNYTWYYVEAGSNRGYLRNDVISVVSGGDTPVTPTPAITSDPSATGYVKTIASAVNLRSKAGYTSMIGRVDRGVTMPYFGTPTTINGVVWYRVYHSTLGYGYIHGSYVTIVNADGSATPTPAPTEAPTGKVIDGEGSQQEASYTTLRLGSTGTAVRNLVQALKDKGYYSGNVISQYTSAVESAVRAYQRANNLSVDGIAGPATQHSLYGTVPEGTNSNLSITLYPAEKIDWWTGGINELWAKGANYKIYDVKTGIVWWAHRWSGGYHVDAEPLTSADTARLCKIYGVGAASEIASKNLYQRRPCLITIGSRTFACSLYGIPHDAKDQTIKTNNFNGVLCVHFTNSWTHGSKKVDSLHTEAIQYALDNAPNGKK